MSALTDLALLPLEPGAAAARPTARSRVTNAIGSLSWTLSDVGVLISSQYSSLHAGYYAIFSGIFQTESQAASGVSAARARGFPDAYQSRVTR